MVRSRPTWKPVERRIRAKRHGVLRGFGSAFGWQVAATIPQQARRGQLTELVAAQSAEPELVLVGHWQGTPASVSTVLVQQVAPYSMTNGRAPDGVLLVVAWDMAPDAPRWLAHRAGERIDFGVTSDGPVPVDDLRTVLESPLGAAAFRDGDAVGVGVLSLSILHPWRIRDDQLEITRRLDLLHRIAQVAAPPAVG